MMKEPNSFAINSLIVLCILHLAAFVTLTVYQLNRITDVERSAGLQHSDSFLDNLVDTIEGKLTNRHNHPHSVPKRSPDQDYMQNSVRTTCRETTLEILHELAEYLLHTQTGHTIKKRQTSNGNEMAKIFEQLANAEVSLFDKYCANDSKLCTPGPQGLPGEKGDAGLKGDPGVAGLAGPQGLPGEKGDAGLKGDTGVAGLAGLKGGPGLLGLKGELGPPGVKGAEGPLGPVGQNGLPGPKGETGQDGVNGLPGPQGPPGRDGPPGPTVSPLTVKALSGPSCCDALAKPSFSQPMQLMRVTEGSTIDVKCDVNGSPSPAITWTPSLDSLDARRYHLNGNVITIDNVAINDSTLFYCKAKNALGQSSKQIVLEVFKHINVVQTPQNHTVLIGLPVKIECKFSGNPTPKITWFRENNDGTRVPVTTGVYSVPGGSQVQIISAFPNDAGKYICQASNGVETIEKSAYLLLQGPPKIQMPPVITANSGKTATLHCNAVGYPPPKTTWFPPPNVNNAYENKDGDLVMLNVEKKDEGQYRCKASNSFGTDSQTFTFQVKETPKVQIKNNQISVGRTTTNFGIDCNTNGEQPLNVQWYHNGSPVVKDGKHIILPDQTLLILGVSKPNDLGTYMCVASNSLGSDNKTALVYEDKGSVTCDSPFAPCELVCGVQCPANCPAATAPVYGTDRYDLSSSVCRSGVHSGVIKNSGGEVIWENASAQPPYAASTRNGVKSSALSTATSLSDAKFLTQ